MRSWENAVASSCPWPPTSAFQKKKCSREVEEEREMFVDFIWCILYWTFFSTPPLCHGGLRGSRELLAYICVASASPQATGLFAESQIRTYTSCCWLSSHLLSFMGLSFSICPCYHLVLFVDYTAYVLWALYPPPYAWRESSLTSLETPVPLSYLSLCLETIAHVPFDLESHLEDPVVLDTDVVGVIWLPSGTSHSFLTCLLCISDVHYFSRILLWSLRYIECLARIYVDRDRVIDIPSLLSFLPSGVSCRPAWFQTC